MIVRVTLLGSCVYARQRHASQIVAAARAR